ncbi:MAG TPA: LPS assembly lipoprotein LptE [Chitinophagaceae bacterium]
MNSFKKTGILAFIALILIVAANGNSGCSFSYKFKDVSIPDTIKTVKVNFFDNKARYVNPQLSPRLTDRLRQKIVNQTRLTQTNNDNADWEINGYISEYNLSTSAISGQQEAGNRLTVGVHVTITGLKMNTPKDYDVSRNFEFAASQSLQQVEQARGEEIIRSLTDDIFNRIFSSW